MSTSIEFYKNMLENNVCEAVVNGLDGPYTLTCTLNSASVKQIGPVTPSNSGELYVWNIPHSRWTSFNIKNLVSFRLLSGASPLAKTLATQKSRSANSKYAVVHDNPKNIVPTAITRSAKRSDYTQKLYKGVCEVTFTKKDGSVRVMKATLQPSVVSSFVTAPQSNTTIDQNVLKVIDVEANDWRTIKIDNILDFKDNIANNIVTSKFDSAMAAPTNKRAFFIDQLHAGPCVVEFEKADGTRRVMNTTLVDEVIKQLGLVPTGSNSSKVDETVIRAVDLDKKEWRSFKVDKVITLTPFVVQRMTTLTAS